MAVLLIDGFDGHSDFNHVRRWEKVGSWAPRGRQNYGRYNPSGTNPDTRDVAGSYMNTGFGHGGQTMDFPNVTGSLFFALDVRNKGFTTNNSYANCAIFRVGSGGAVNIVQGFVCRWDVGDDRYYYEVWTGGDINDRHGDVQSGATFPVNPQDSGESETWRRFSMDFGSGQIKFGDYTYNGTAGGDQPIIHYRNFGQHQLWFDNCYVTDDADLNVGDLGACHVQLLTPIMNDAISSGIIVEPGSSAAWEVVEQYWRSGVLDVPEYDDYLTSQSGDAATFIKTYPYAYAEPKAVAVTVVCHAMDGSVAYVLPTLKIGGVTYYANLGSGTFTPKSPELPWDVVLSPQAADRTSIQYVWNRNPATNLAWEFSDISQVLIGYHQSGGGEVRIQGIYCEVLSPVGVAVMVDGYGSKIY